jgi:hypothetical protein
MSATKKNESLKCSQQVRSIPLERYRLPDDGRKWRQAARSRSDLLLRLSSYANGDGTFVRNGRNYSPSLETLVKHVAEKSYFRLTNALQTLGLLSWDRQRHYDRRVYTIHLPETPVNFDEEHLSDSQITPVTSDVEGEKHLSHSPEHLSFSPKSTVTMGDNPSLPSKEPREREPSGVVSDTAESKLSLSPAALPSKAMASQKVKPVNQEDIAALQALCFTVTEERGSKEYGWGRTPAASDVERLLRWSSRDEITDALTKYVAGLEDKDIRWVEKTFFRDGGAAGIIVSKRQTDWKESIANFMDATEFDDFGGITPNDFLEVPVGMETKAWSIINDAQKHYKRLLDEAFVTKKVCPICDSPDIFRNGKHWKCQACIKTRREEFLKNATCPKCGGHDFVQVSATDWNCMSPECVQRREAIKAGMAG